MITKKNFQDEELPHELFLTARQNTEIRNTFNKNMSTDTRLSKTQLSKIIQLGGFLGELLVKFSGPLMKVAVPLAKNVLAPLATVLFKACFNLSFHLTAELQIIG